MRLASPFLLIVALLGGPVGTRSAAAQEAPDATVGRESPIEVVTQEPRAVDPNALVHNAALLDELLTRSTEQTIREQKFAAAAGITGGMILVGLAAWRLIEADPQSAYSRGLGVMFMTLGISPELTQVTYRIGDSVTNSISPLNPYIIVMLVFVQQQHKKAGLGTLISMMLPYAVVLAVVWSILLVVWIAFGIPLGVEGPLGYAP